MKVIAVQCPDCKMWVYSRHRHDMRWCPCKTVAIDGGRDYIKISYHMSLCGMKIKQRVFNIKATHSDLYVDFNTYGNKFGYIKPHVAARARKRKKHD